MQSNHEQFPVNQQSPYLLLIEGRSSGNKNISSDPTFWKWRWKSNIFLRSQSNKLSPELNKDTLLDTVLVTLQVQQLILRTDPKLGSSFQILFPNVFFLTYQSQMSVHPLPKHFLSFGTTLHRQHLTLPAQYAPGWPDFPETCFLPPLHNPP